MFEELFTFQNREVFSIALGALVFLVSFSVLQKRLRIQKGAAALVGLAFGALVSYYFYNNTSFYGEMTLSLGLIVIALVILVVIIFIFTRFFKKRF